MKETLISIRYAKALFEFAEEKNLIEELKQDCDLIIEVCSSNKDLVRMLKSPVIKSDKKQSVLTLIFDGKINDLTLRYLLIITQKGREAYLPGISKQFIALYRKHHNIISATLTTVTRADSPIVSRVRDLLKKVTGATIELSQEVNEELLGGFVVSFDDKQYDASLLKQIKNLQKDFNVNLYIRGF
ncbi:MAG: ATP synthase F1 subunit delta [Bacteroidales bacterium]|nr:ATP synthase F1 subunit delta [Bacteroidales bacterium]